MEGVINPTVDGAAVQNRGALPRRQAALLIIGVGAATAAAHIGNNFTTFLIGGLIDRFGFTPIEMGAWSMAETLAYASVMFLVAPSVAKLSPRLLMIAAGFLVASAQCASALLAYFPLLLLGRIVAGVGFGLANTALNLAAGRAAHPARAISAGIACQTLLYALINVVLPMIGARFGVAGMFLALGGLAMMFTLAAGCLPVLPGGAGLSAAEALRLRIGPDGWRVLATMACFTFGSLAIWQFIERAAHAIGISAVSYGRYQSLATLASAGGNMLLAAIVGRLPRTLPLVLVLLSCSFACACLTTVGDAGVFAIALLVFNVSWFLVYPLLLGISYGVDATGRLAVLNSAVWLLMMSLGSLCTGIIAQILGGYTAIGPLGGCVCLCAITIIWPLVRRLDS